MSKKAKDKKDNYINSTSVSESLDNKNESTSIDVLIDDSLVDEVLKDRVKELENEIVSSDNSSSITKESDLSSSNVTENSIEENKKAKSKKKKKRSKSSIFLYIVSVLFLGYMCFNAYDTYKYIGELISYGSIDPSTQAKDIVSYYINTCSPYAFYFIATWSLGLVLAKMNEIKSLIKIENNK